MNEKLVLALPGLNGLSEQGDEKTEVSKQDDFFEPVIKNKSLLFNLLVR